MGSATMADDRWGDLPLSVASQRPPEAEHTTQRSEADERAAQIERDIERLIPIAQELAGKAGRNGVTMPDLRYAGQRRGIFTGEESGRTLSWLNRVFPEAGLVKTGLFRESHLPKQHNIPRRVYVLPAFYDPGLHSAPKNVFAVAEGD